MVHILDSDAYEKLVTMEGHVWKKEDENSFGDLYSFRAFREKYETLIHGSDVQEVCPDVFMKVENNTSIYGSGGINRYFVKNSGEICFSSLHAISAEAIEKARVLGFSIHE